MKNRVQAFAFKCNLYHYNADSSVVVTFEAFEEEDGCEQNVTGHMRAGWLERMREDHVNPDLTEDISRTT